MSRYRRLVNEVPTTAVLLVGGYGLVMASGGRWRVGLFLLGAACVAGAVSRLVLPARRAGLLAVRGRTLDVVVLAGLGAAVLVLAAVVPAG